MARVATAQTDRDWAAWARGKPVAEVERRVAASKPGESPRDRNWGGSPARYPYRLNVTPEVHQVFESLAGILTQKTGAEVSVEEALIDAARRRIAEEINADGASGAERKLPSSYRLVNQRCPDCLRAAAATPDGPSEIPAERALALADGAELLDLGGEVVGEIDRQGSSSELEKVITCELFSSQVLENTHPRIEHSGDLSTPGTSVVPKEERDPPTPPELLRKVLSRDGYFCQIPGCCRLATHVHHIRWRSHGGCTSYQRLLALCDG